MVSSNVESIDWLCQASFTFIFLSFSSFQFLYLSSPSHRRLSVPLGQSEVFQHKEFPQAPINGREQSSVCLHTVCPPRVKTMHLCWYCGNVCQQKVQQKRRVWAQLKRRCSNQDHGQRGLVKSKLENTRIWKSWASVAFFIRSSSRDS